VKQGAGKGQKKCGIKEYAFFSSTKVEIENIFILECKAFKDNRKICVDIMVASCWDNLFSEGFFEKLGAFIVRLHRKRVDYINQKEAICPISYL